MMDIRESVLKLTGLSGSKKRIDNKKSSRDGASRKLLFNMKYTLLQHSTLACLLSISIFT
jgi:hypothetical protein